MRKERKEKEMKEVNTVIGEGTKIKGDISCEGSLRIDGAVEGNVLNVAEVIIGEKGIVKGNINAGKVNVAGSILGDITVSQEIEITTQAKVEGNISGPKIGIAPGAIFKGQCNMKAEKENSQPEIEEK